MTHPPLETTGAAAVRHPLDPLAAGEIALAVALIRDTHGRGKSLRFGAITLNEPEKLLVLSWKPTDPIARSILAQVIDTGTGSFYEAIVSVSDAAVVSWTLQPGLQPPLLVEEMFDCETSVKADPAFQAALALRGVTDMSLVMVDVWAVGHYGDEPAGETDRRMARSIPMVRADANDNGYARPIEGLLIWVDLLTMEVVRVEDTGVVPLPPQPGNYAPEYVAEFGGAFRGDVKPISITQPEGPSFKVDDYHVSWQKWSFRLGFTPREGLVIHTLGYEDGGRIRPILYRASLSEMVVPYGDPLPAHSRKNAFDLGEYGIGVVANALELGCDCLGEIKYFDAFLSSSRGEPVRMPNVICMHEEDYGILWKHVDWRTEQTEVRRSRRLVVSFIATVSNYEYGFFWYLYQDGTVQFEIKLTGILSTGALPPGEKRKYGALVAPQLYAPHHQHFFNVRLDMTVDGIENSVVEVNTEAEPPGPGNPDGNAFYPVATTFKTERQAQRMADPLGGRFWKIVNANVLNSLGEPVAYKLIPGDNVRLFVNENACVARRARFMTRHLWVTPWAPGELYAAGDYPNQNAVDSGLGLWTQADRAIENTDVVVWYTFGSHHIVRLEDWPVMPTAYTGFHLKPTGFFDRSPALDVPPAEPAHCCAVTQEIP